MDEHLRKGGGKDAKGNQLGGENQPFPHFFPNFDRVHLGGRLQIYVLSSFENGKKIQVGRLGRSCNVSSSRNICSI